MKSYEKNRLPHIIFGSGSLENAGVKFKQMGVTKCLIVTTKGMVKRGTVGKLQEYLEREEIESGIYDEVLPDPPDVNCLAVRELIRKEKYDGVIGFGGGSSMDVAKVGSLLAGIDETIEELHDYSMQGTKMKASYDRPVALMTIPTTSGSGAECTATGVITSTSLHLKYSIGNENAIADIVIVDPLLTVGMPKSLTVHSGLDVLCHCVENVIGIRQNEYSNMIMLSCIERVWKWLPIAAEEPDNLEAREQLSWAAHNALCNGGLPNGHAVAHAIGAMYHITHGHACAMTLPTVLGHFSESADAVDSIRKLVSIMGLTVTGNTHDDAYAAADAVVRFYKSFGLGTLRETMKQNGFDDDRETFIKKAIPLVMDDFKSRLWDPPIHTDNYEEKVGRVLGMIYDEE